MKLVYYASHDHPPLSDAESPTALTGDLGETGMTLGPQQQAGLHKGDLALGPHQLSRLVDTLASHYADWQSLITPDLGRRVYRQIWDHESANAWMIAWCPGQDTGWHDHDDAAAAIRALHGEVIEERMQLGGGATARRIEPGRAFYVPPTAIHRVRHTGAQAAVTVHCYSPPLRRQGGYSIGPGSELLRTAQSLEQELRAEPAPV